MTIERQNSSLETIFSLFAVLLTLGALLVLFLLPQIKERNAYDEKLKAGTQLVDKLQQKYDRLYTQKQASAEKDNAIAEALDNRAEEAAMQQWFEQFFSRCKVQKISASERLVVTGRLQSPSAVYELIDTIGEAPWVLKLEMPLSLLGNDGDISATLHFQVVRDEGPQEAAQKSPGV